MRRSKKRTNLTCCIRALAAAILLPAGLAHAACPAHKDFLVRSDPTLAPVRPADCGVTAQTPPEFTWPPQNGENTYEVVVTFPDGKQESRKTNRNWLLWDKAMPAGRYSWRVNVSGANSYKSDARSFTIANDAVPFLVPAGDALLQHARSTPRCIT